MLEPGDAVKIFLSLILLALITSIALAGEPYDVWFGTGGNNANVPAGIYHATFDAEKGELSASTLAMELPGAGWVTLHPTLPVLYSAGYAANKPVLAVFKIGDGESLTKISETPIVANSCFLGVDPTGKVLASAQYGGGNAISVALNEDGSFAGEPTVYQHSGGSKVVKGRQNSPHPHYCGFSPDNKFVFVPDLGLDQMVRYRLDGNSLVADGAVECIAGGGPRHMKFHTSGKFAFLLNELELSVSVFEYADGEMKLHSTVAALDQVHKDGEVFNSSSEVRVHPSGKFIYTGNRGHDSISVFSFDEQSGKLERIQIVSVHGAWPRNFNLTPCGKWLIAAGQHTNSATVFAVDESTGQLKYQKQSVFVPGPICVVIR